MDASLNGPLGPISLTTAILTLGRVQDNQIVVNDPKASSHHAEIHPTVYGYSIVDLGSTNGTYVNEQRLEPHNPRPLNSADTIRIGDTRFTYTTSGSSSDVPPTVYASPGSNFSGDGYQPTVSAPPPGYNNYAPPSAPPQFSSPNYQGYAPPQQPGYPSPGAPAFAQPQQPNRNLRWLWITLGIVGVLLVVVCGVCAFLGFVVNKSTPNKTLDAFCSDLNNKHYHDAYLQLSPSIRSTTPENTFTTGISGISSCTHTDASDDGTLATSTLTLRNSAGQSLNFTANLTKDSNNDWKISSLQKSI